jgi:hypothetical protein
MLEAFVTFSCQSLETADSLKILFKATATGSAGVELAGSVLAGVELAGVELAGVELAGSVLGNVDIAILIFPPNN